MYGITLFSLSVLGLTGLGPQAQHIGLHQVLKHSLACCHRFNSCNPKQVTPEFRQQVLLVIDMHQLVLGALGGAVNLGTIVDEDGQEVS